MHFAIIDIETTGGSPKDSKVTEIAIYKHDGKEIIDEYSTLVNPEIPIPPFIVNLTGISEKMVKNAPKFFEIAKKLIEFTEGCIFVAHNVSFDYSVIRYEFNSLGFDYRRAHLCTVRSSRFIIPDHDSYSLGKLTKNLGIALIGRHRAGGDALATAKLFGLLYKKDQKSLETFIQEELNPKRLHPNLDIKALDEIPNKTGVYKFFNPENQLIYIGNSIDIKKSVEHHLRNTKTNKSAKMQPEISRIEFELTGSELIALLLESEIIRQHQPVYNKSSHKNKISHGFYNYIDKAGYTRFFIGLKSNTSGIPLASFMSKKDGDDFMAQVVKKNKLCGKLCDLYNTNHSCFKYEIKECAGACMQEESTESYNKRCQEAINQLNLLGNSFYVIDKGRERAEKTLILFENGSLKGYGYAPFHFNKSSVKKWKTFIDFIIDTPDSIAILELFLRKSKKHEIINI
ncbi:MAG: exonuclease domain-containing protein [Crocinitomicaceae bacterium]